MVDAPPSSVPPAGLILALPRGPGGGEVVPGLLPVGGLTLLRRLLLALDHVGGQASSRPLVVVTSPASLRAVSHDLGHRGTPVATSATTRLGAIADGLTALEEIAPHPTAVLIHDAERGLTPAVTIREVLDGFAEAVASDAAEAVVPGIAVTDSVKARGALGLVNVDREGLTTLQSPRALRRDLLDRVLAARDEREMMPDDEIRAAIALGARVRVVPGSHVGGEVVDRLGLWQAQISLGLARDTSPRRDGA